MSGETPACPGHNRPMALYRPSIPHRRGARAHSEADIPSQSLSETLAELKNALGVVLTSKLEPERASPAPLPRADAEALVVIPKSESRAAVEAFNERAGKGMDYNDLMARLRKLGAPV
jgi:hypothetical protein